VLRSLRRLEATREGGSSEPVVGGTPVTQYWLPGLEEEPRRSFSHPGARTPLRSGPRGRLRLLVASGRWRVGILALLLVVVAWAVLVLVSIVGAARSVTSAERELGPFEHLRLQTASSGIVTLVAKVDRGALALSSARRDLDEPWVRATHWIPWVGTQTTSASELTAAASDAADALDGLLSTVVSLGAKPPTSAASRLADLGLVARSAQRAEHQLAGLALGPSHGLIGPLGDKRRLLAAELSRANGIVSDVRTSATVLGSLLRGPTSLLVLAGNDAEMRNGSGMFLQVGRITATSGHLRLSSFRSAPLGDLPAPGVTLPVQVERVWGWQEPGRFWEEVGIDPSFPTSARTAEALWARDGGSSVDGVVAIDTSALVDLVKALGPVEVEGRKLDASALSHYLLLGQYRGLGYPTAEQAGRRERLGQIADQVFGRLEHGPFTASELAAVGVQLAKAVSGRHLMVYSDAPGLERDWQRLGAAGSFPANGLMVSVQNRGGNKLDQFLHVSVAVAKAKADPSESGSGLTLEVRLHNEAPSTGLPRYVSGPFPGLDVAPGTYVGIVTFDLPRGVSDVRVLDGARPDAAGSVGASVEVGTPVTLPAGGETTLSIALALPKGLPDLTWLPSGRYPPERRNFDGRSLPAGRQVTLRP
jgi:hypothetical protein